MKEFTSFTVVLLWLCGIVIAKGFWITLLAIVLPPYALYLVIERLLTPFL